MKNLKLLSKNYFLVIIFSLFFGFVTNSKEPVDIWEVDEKKPEEAAPADEKKAEAGDEAGGDEAAAMKLPKGDKLAYNKREAKPEKPGSKEQPTDLVEKTDKSPLEKAAEETPTVDEPKTEAPKDATPTTEATKEDKKSEVAEKEEKKPEAEKAIPE